MFRRTRKLTLSDYLLILANLVPVVGVWVWKWSPQEVFLVYCFETIIIGIFTLVKMAIVSVFRRKDTWYANGRKSQQPGLFFMLFFFLHYGIFVTVQMGIFFAVSGIWKDAKVTALNFFYKWPELIDHNTLIMLGTFVVGYAYRLVSDFIIPKQYKTISLIRLMFQPYGRIFVQQITVIAGSMFLALGAGKVFILVFALVKIFFEVYFNFESYLDKGLKQLDEGSGKQ